MARSHVLFVPALAATLLFCWSPGGRVITLAQSGRTALIVSAPRTPTMRHVGKIKDLGGKHTVRDFILKRGVTYRITRSLTVNASGRIEIDAPILLEPGVRVKLTARGSIVNKGRIGPDPNPPSAKLRPLDGGTSSACPPRPTFSEKTDGEFSYIEVDQDLTGAYGGNAADGTGCSGGDINLFSVDIFIRANIRGGNGGVGRVASKITLSTSSNSCRNDHVSEVSLRGKNGGGGGSVYLHATGNTNSTGRIDMSKTALVKGGNGGNGGSVGFEDSIASAPSGSEGHAGADMSAWSGDGGPAGHAAGNHGTYPVLFDSGRDGKAGSIYVAAGNGGPPSCAGGSTVVILGGPGSVVGDYFRDRPTTANESEYADAIIVSGGNGFPERSRDPMEPGGRGGSVTLLSLYALHLHTTPFVEFIYAKEITITQAGNGGPGFDGCPNGPINGTSGGPGGSLRRVDAHTPTVTNSFNGSAGGDGWKGAGGPGGAGSHDFPATINNSFMPGTPGSVCPPKWKQSTGGGFTTLQDDISHFGFSVGIGPGACGISPQNAAGQTTPGYFYVNFTLDESNQSTQPAKFGLDSFKAPDPTVPGKEFELTPGWSRDLSGPPLFFPKAITLPPGQTVIGGANVQVPDNFGGKSIDLWVARQPGDDPVFDQLLRSIQVPAKDSSQPSGDGCFAPPGQPPPTATPTPQPTATPTVTPASAPTATPAQSSPFALKSNPTQVTGTFTVTGTSGNCGTVSGFSDTLILSLSGGTLTITQPSTQDISTGSINPDGTFTVSHFNESYSGKIDGTGAGSATNMYTDSSGCTVTYHVQFGP